MLGKQFLLVAQPPCADVVTQLRCCWAGDENQSLSTAGVGEIKGVQAAFRASTTFSEPATRVRFIPRVPVHLDSNSKQPCAFRGSAASLGISTTQRLGRAEKKEKTLLSSDVHGFHNYCYYDYDHHYHYILFVFGIPPVAIGLGEAIPEHPNAGFRKK